MRRSLRAFLVLLPTSAIFGVILSHYHGSPFWLLPIAGFVGADMTWEAYRDNAFLTPYFDFRSQTAAWLGIVIAACEFSALFLAMDAIGYFIAPWLA